MTLSDLQPPTGIMFRSLTIAKGDQMRVTVKAVSALNGLEALPCMECRLDVRQEASRTAPS